MKIIDDFYSSNFEPNNNKILYERYIEFSENIKSITKKRGNNQEINKWLAFKEFCKFSETSFLFRKSNNEINFSSVLWISQLREVANSVFQINSVPPYTKIDNTFLRNFATSSQDVKGLKTIGELLLTKGIILIINKQFPGMKTDGAVFLLDSGNPVIGLTLRYSRLDSFWFTLFHELSHVSLHYEKIDNVILDDLDEPDETDIERDADFLALESLIPANKWRSARLKYQVTKEALVELASELKIHPSIVAGRYRRENNNYTVFSDIVNALDLKEVFK
ncbi:ImmA/IrrE family metallo-endopeptidase [Leptospira vanthielii]|uniref:ImmA/IrrE family metallo-endopeptidase n=1 Tax=Leptospira vanthielii TaxID=293085 RepID=A0ABY2NJI0_9LEPT|nr:ImmA/IrrE family metallo-endopeptidase [Leptospira vanthielii]TGM45980.1 ImmA/IrrE family metallo-endopeptidase [Leptospira vanthielii]